MQECVEAGPSEVRLFFVAGSVNDLLATFGLFDYRPKRERAQYARNPSISLGRLRPDQVAFSGALRWRSRLSWPLRLAQRGRVSANWASSGRSLLCQGLTIAQRGLWLDAATLAE
jgi:hypothetical protein